MRKYIPRPVKKFVRKTKATMKDAVNFVLGNNEDLVPPQRKIFIGNGDFKKIGDAALDSFIKYANLKPNHKVLDIGSGIGRIAVSLAGYLDKEKGSYEGFDIVPHGIKWCQENISTRYPNFHFCLADIQNKEYNPRGRYSGSEYIFPYDNNTFDFVFLTSVFTHMLPGEVQNYFSEISRVIKKDGILFASYFLINEESQKGLASGSSSQKFERQGDYWTVDKKVPETAVAYGENFIFSLHQSNGFSIMNPLHFGSWCGRKQALGYQDVIIAKKQ